MGGQVLVRGGRVAHACEADACVCVAVLKLVGELGGDGEVLVDASYGPEVVARGSPAEVEAVHAVVVSHGEGCCVGTFVAVDVRALAVCPLVKVGGAAQYDGCACCFEGVDVDAG